MPDAVPQKSKIKVPLDKMLEHSENQYRLLRIASQRAKQLYRGAKPRVEDSEGQKHTTVALRELAEGLIEYTIGEPPPESGEDTEDAA